MKKRILCFGDSNTWGAVPNQGERFPSDIRWTGLLQSKLGEGFEIIEEGLCGRTVATKVLNLASKGEGLEYFYHGASYFYPCVLSHDPLDLVVVMLGTNDLKDKFQNSIEKIARDLEKYFIELFVTEASHFLKKPELLIISPIAMNEESDYVQSGWSNGNSKLSELESAYRSIAERRGVHFFSAFDERYLGEDGLHFGAEGHALFAEELSVKIRTIFS